MTYGDEGVEHLSVTVSSELTGLRPAGTVKVKESTTTLKPLATTVCVITLKSAKGSCTLSAKKLPVGTYDFVATYGGSANFKGSTSAKETLTVTM
ncbi:MAG: Ig-like domain-containing protein [Acidimicrobiales bacterium]